MNKEWPRRSPLEPIEPLNPLGEKSKDALQPTIAYPGPDDDPQVACYKLGYDVGFNKALDVAIEFLGTLKKAIK
jgi:hypothetical protein